MFLEQINATGDIRKISPRDYAALADEIRAFLVTKVGEHGGHLASNLGTVELTMALHLAFDLPKDKLIFDVGHQCYTHKILTGRKDGFDTLRTLGGMSGFPKQAERETDLFDTGHSSTSVSMGMGLAKARDAAGEDYAVVSVIGDGSMTGGMAFEALNNASRMKSNFIIVLNDNDMSISHNIGGMNRAFQNLRTEPGYTRLKENVKQLLNSIPDFGSRMVSGVTRVKNSLKQLVVPDMLFEDMDLTYLGPVDGHDIRKMVSVFEDARRLNKAVVVHVVTQKGKGYKFAEEDPERFHGVGPFDPSTGKLLSAPKKTYTDHVSDMLLEMAAEDRQVVAVTAAMAYGTGLARFEEQYPYRFFDVGIAEQHAVSFAAGLAKGGLKPYVCIYSTFLQRSYDQIVHDVCLQDLPVRLLIDRAGIVGEDGETHQGMLDVGYLRTCPGITIMAPKDGRELKAMLRFSLDFGHPLAIRYPRGAAPESVSDNDEPIICGKAEILRKGRDVILFAAGSMVRPALDAADILAGKGFAPTVVNARFLKPLDEELLAALSSDHRLCAVISENCRSGGLGEAVEDLVFRRRLPLEVLNLEPEDAFIPQGKPAELRKKLKLDASDIADAVIAHGASPGAGRIRKFWERLGGRS